jgi:hypothetical protein
MGFFEIISWKKEAKKNIILLFLLFLNTVAFSQSPLILDNNFDNEIWLEGEIVIFNGYPPNLRMIVMDNNIIGIDENNVPDELEIYLNNGLSLRGMFKLKFVRKINIQYYETELLLFRIIEYKNIELIMEN